MRVLFLLTQDLESPSGLGRYWPWAREMARAGHTVRLVGLHPRFESLSERRFTREGVEVCYAAPMHVKKQDSQKSYYSGPELVWVVLRATQALIRAALRSPADLVVVGKPHPMNTLAGLAARQRWGAKLLVDCDDLEAASNRTQGSWQRDGLAYFEKHAPHWADAVSTNTYFQRDLLLGRGVPASRVVYVPNGVDLERFANSKPEKTAELRQQLNLEGCRVAVYVGSLSLPSHPVDLLVRAFQSVHATLPEARLLLVGGGEDLENLRDLASSLGLADVVGFTGRISPDEVPAYYGLGQVSVDPVRDDDAARGRCPLKMFESWACGVPFVTARVGDRPTLAGEPPAAALVRPEEPDDLANTLIRVLSDEAEALRLSRAGRTRVSQFDWKAIASRLDSNLRAALEGSR